MLTLGGIAVAIMVVILLVFFNVRWRLLPLAVILIGVVWAFGLAGYLGIPLTIVTIAGLPVMLGVGIDYAIQMHARVEEEVLVGRADHPIQETARNLGPALLVVTFDAIFAFAALRFAKVPMIRQFGLLLAVGIAVICFASIIIPLAILGIREFKSPTSRKTDGFEPGYLGRFTERIGSLPSASAIPLIIASLVIFFGGLAGGGQAHVADRPDRVGQPEVADDQGHQEARQRGALVERDGRVRAHRRRLLRRVRHVRAHVHASRRWPSTPGLILTGSSIETAVGDLLEVPGASDIAPTGADVKAAFDVAPPDIQASSVADGGKAFNIVFRTGRGVARGAAPMVREVRSQTHPPAGISATPAGLAVVGVGPARQPRGQPHPADLPGDLVRVPVPRGAAALDRAVAAVAGAGAHRRRHGVAGGVGLSLKLSPMTAVGGPLVIAACTEFTSLILLRFIEERRRGLDPKEAVDVAASRTGRAFIVSGMTAIAGVAVLSFSSLPLLRDFGRIVAMNVTVALLSALVVLPPMLVWADKRNWVSRGLVKPVLEPYIDTPPLGGASPAPAD